MKEQKLINRAIKKGQLLVTLPAIFLLIGTSITGLITFRGLEDASNYYLVSFLAGFIFSWFYWSLSITWWKVWAYKNVNNIEMLESEAVKGQLLWPKGSWFNRTALITKRQRELLRIYADQPSSIEIEIERDFPIITRLYYPKSNLLIDLLLPILMSLVGGYLVFSGNQVLGALIIILSIYRLSQGLKKVKRVLGLNLSIDHNGVSVNDEKYRWEEIMKFEAREGIRGRSDQDLILNTNKSGQILNIGDFNLHAEEINDRIEYYRSRKN
ncbi:MULTISPECIES: hypothetical protein [Roseivirga]|jgi:hypothetical protein|uniref:DUF304 domain-containing protein n=1 Tax=Roseivirga thermotolerans TaxID=1758176 RepID=A0ABQ3I5D7_9BACT|nr:MULTISPECIES: hypothetical protein [Roseivirga]GHE59280.1 hypothetical protein GCM10011340_12380 [Roseivirga thermotolerans]|tara:strand:+ start:2926 stop:3732 length:807 start_codon:yes stop_codon:yes gene_type:complete